VFNHGILAVAHAWILAAERDSLRGLDIFTVIEEFLVTRDTQISTGTANFLSGGLGSFALWCFGIPADNVKKYSRNVPYIEVRH
jgi:hypothetical protein